MRIATLSECYQACRSEGMGIIGGSFFAFVLFMRETKIGE
jgi:hypothetical protein